jgi:hypothetical protein
VTVAAEHSNVAATLTVTVNVEPLPRIGLAQSTVHFTAIRGSISPLSQTVGIVNLGGGVLGVVDCPDAPTAWLTCTADASGVHLVASPVGLSSSPAPVVVQVTAVSLEGISQGAATVTVSMSLEQPVLAVTPTNAQIQGTGSVNVQASNIGAGTLLNLGTIGCSQPANITCSVNQNTGVLTITTVPGNLTPGTYIRVVDVTAANANNSQTVTVVLTVPSP